MVIKTKIVPRRSGFSASSFKTNPMATGYVDIVYKKRGKLGKFLKIKSIKRINLPKGSSIKEIKNNYPKVGQVSIKYSK